MKIKHVVLNEDREIELTEQKHPIIADPIIEKKVGKNGGVVTLQFYGFEKKLKKMGILK